MAAAWTIGRAGVQKSACFYDDCLLYVFSFWGCTFFSERETAHGQNDHRVYR